MKFTKFNSASRKKRAFCEVLWAIGKKNSNFCHSLLAAKPLTDHDSEGGATVTMAWIFEKSLREVSFNYLNKFEVFLNTIDFDYDKNFMNSLQI